LGGLPTGGGVFARATVRCRDLLREHLIVTGYVVGSQRSGTEGVSLDLVALMDHIWSLWLMGPMRARLCRFTAKGSFAQSHRSGLQTGVSCNFGGNFIFFDSEVIGRVCGGRSAANVGPAIWINWPSQTSSSNEVNNTRSSEAVQFHHRGTDRSPLISRTRASAIPEN